MRVIAGRFKGRRLAAPPRGVRPTTDSVRERLFAVLGGSLPGGSAVDLFCGAGTLGIEALSRGAERAIFVDSSAGSLRILAKNIAALGEKGLDIELHRRDALRFVERHWPEGPVQWVFLDPPYGDKRGATCLEALGRLHAKQLGWVVFEGSGAPVAIPGTLARERVLECGDTQVTLMRGGLRS